MRQVLTDPSHSPSTPTPDESAAALEALRRIAPFVAEVKALKFRVSGSKETIALPVRAVRLLADLLSLMANGNGVTLIPSSADLTTQQAAEVLGISRPRLVEMLESRQLPFYKVGTHRRVRLQDVSRLKAMIAEMGTVSEESLENEPETEAVSKVLERSMLGRALYGRSSPLAFEWTPEAQDQLGKYSDQDIAKRLGISRSSVALRRRMFQIQMRRPPSSSFRGRGVEEPAPPSTSPPEPV